MWRLFLFAAFACSAGAATLFRDPGPVASLDLAGGPGGRHRAPQPPFTFVREETEGTAPKVLVRDARGTQWSVKFGEEAKAETFASRIAWAAGYLAEPTYFVREGRIEGAGQLRRAAAFVQGGQFEGARFELRDPSSYRLVPDSSWTLEDKRVDGTRELNGLKLTVMLVSNWDVKRQNLAILETEGRQYFAITDWGASMGRASDFSGRSKWDCRGFTLQSGHFADGVGDGYVTFHYDGKDRDLIRNNIRIEDVKWFMSRMGGLTDAQIRAALDASGATPAESDCFAPALRQRLNQLASVASGQIGSSVTGSRTVTRTTTKAVPRQD